MDKGSTVMSLFGLQYVSRDVFATASSTGSVHLFQHTVGGHLEHKTSWKQIHSFIGSNVKFKLSHIGFVNFVNIAIIIDYTVYMQLSSCIEKGVDKQQETC